ncbi:integral membrane sensor signal transduction histidine kinase [Paenibacillus curdlanolyticus YK9]|uniref:histidine kinase n=1 Tax=Paenibacillus curdlanolyticus YK9 TaxID=717606 RepID=E0IF23_9BACL|nr:HAMP domain-containing sensor histidine kinase [Paenibacillus curdlanolyticus]EFM08799.1 integral membrane sensor signal transduction histidine kinase [Paenibacillus curdlanolyticus YK9]
MKRERRLFTTLTKSYVLFGITIMILYSTLGFLIREGLDLGRSHEITAGTLVRPDYEHIPYDKVEGAGGAIQVLDERKHVVYARGEFDGTITDRYSSEELLHLLEDGTPRSYKTTLAAFPSESGQTYYLLAMMPKSGSYVHLYINFSLLLSFLVTVYMFSRWTANRITGPLEKIVHGIRRMRDGKYQERLSYESNYEFAQIQEHFNRMAAALEHAERDKKELESIKQRMMLDLSHDLKTPITTIQGYAKALQLGMANNQEQQQQYLDIIYRKSQTVTLLIEDMFQLAVLESPDYPFASVLCDLAELLRNLTIEFYDIFENKGFLIEIHIPDTQLLVPMNDKLLYRALSNLLANTLQHNPEGTQVSIRLEETTYAARILICDNGVGIPAELKETLFQPFARGTTVRRSGGTGLGLAIAHRTAELHKGTLRLLDDAAQTVFEMNLPKRVND